MLTKGQLEEIKVDVQSVSRENAMKVLKLIIILLGINKDDTLVRNQ